MNEVVAGAKAELRDLGEAARALRSWLKKHRGVLSFAGAGLAGVALGVAASRRLDRYRDKCAEDGDG